MGFIFEKIHISIYKLSKKTGLAWSTIKNYKNACKIADALNISLDQLRKEVNKNEKQFK